MDHQVEHHRHVGAARVERREPVAVDEQRMLHVRQRGADRAVEALDVPDLHHHALRLGERQQFVGLLERRGDRLLDQQVLPASSAALATAWWAGVGVTIESASTSASSASSDGYAERRVPRHGRRALGVRLIEAAERDAGHAAQQPRMVVSQASRARDADAQRRAQVTAIRARLASTNSISALTSAHRLQLGARLLQRLADVELRAEQEAVRLLQLGDHLVAEAPALQSDAVEAVQLDRVADRLHERRHVLRHARAAADERVAARSSRTGAPRRRRR